MVKIKVCGMTNLDDCLKAQELAIEFVGFVFYSRSRRCVTPHQVREITGELRPPVRTVGVFVEEGDEEVGRIVDYCRLDLAQVYRESALPNTIRAFRVADRLPCSLPREGLMLFDSYTDGFGGSGHAFDRGLLSEGAFLDRAFIAGGISEQNAGDVLSLKPFGIDLVSSLEAYPGKKDHAKMERFVKTVRSFTL
jgi:phosphoribosylanthranilate isomerase